MAVTNTLPSASALMFFMVWSSCCCVQGEAECSALGGGLEVVTDVGAESAVEGVVSSASAQLLLCLDVEFLTNTGCSVLALDSNFWSNRQKTRFLCGENGLFHVGCFLYLTLETGSRSHLLNHTHQGFMWEYPEQGADVVAVYSLSENQTLTFGTFNGFLYSFISTETQSSFLLRLNDDLGVMRSLGNQVGLAYTCCCRVMLFTYLITDFHIKQMEFRVAIRKGNHTQEMRVSVCFHSPVLKIFFR